MAKALKCDLCENQATVHLTQILNNKIHKVDLCESCAQEKGVTDPNGFSLADLLIKSAAEDAESSEEGAEGATCPSCGYSRKDFRKSGRVGCPDCYDHFGETITSILGNMHKGTRHCGKVPANARAAMSYREEVARLENDLKKAVEAERYEEAAEYRDRIQEVKKTRNETE